MKPGVPIFQANGGRTEQTHQFGSNSDRKHSIMGGGQSLTAHLAGEGDVSQPRNYNIVPTLTSLQHHLHNLTGRHLSRLSI